MYKYIRLLLLLAGRGEVSKKKSIVFDWTNSYPVVSNQSDQKSIQSMLENITLKTRKLFKADF